MLLVDDVNFRFTLSTQAPLNHRRDRTMTTQHDELELQESIERDVEAMKTFPYAWLQNFAEGKADSKGRPVTEKDVELIARSLGNRINSILDSVEDLRSRTGKGEEWKAPKLVLVPAIDRIGITKEAARGIWQSQLKHCAQSGDESYRNKECLIDLLRDLSMLTGQDMTLPLGQFLIDAPTSEKESDPDCDEYKFKIPKNPEASVCWGLNIHQSSHSADD